MTEMVTYAKEGDVAVVRLDDGKVNAFGFDMLKALNAALDRCGEDTRAVALLGRDGIFSGGFDLKVIKGDDRAAIRDLGNLGFKTLRRLCGWPQPVVIGCGGHAVALAALFLLCADHRVGATGDFKIGLNESEIGLALPPFAIALARERLSPLHLTRSVIAGTLFAPTECVEVGFLDAVTAPDAVATTAIAEAERLGRIDHTGFAANKLGLRRALVEWSEVG